MENIEKIVNNMGYNSEIKKNLEKEFNAALKDEEFKNLVSKIKLPKEILMKYTSLLETSSKEIKNCKNCKNLLECKNNVEGYVYLPKVNEKTLEFNYKACKKKEATLKNKAYLESVSYYNASEGLKNAQMKDIYTNDSKRLEVVKWLKTFIDNYPNVKKGLYLYGNFGCGKSYLISALFNELGKRKIKSAVVFWPEFLRDLKASFGVDFNSKFEYIKRVPILLIDDIGAENMTSWSRDEILCSILQYRMDEKLTTFFTSNLTIKDLEEHFSFSARGIEKVKAKRIIERIKHLTIEMTLVSENKRERED